jgi:hypothetical protein
MPNQVAAFHVSSPSNLDDYGEYRGHAGMEQTFRFAALWRWRSPWS